jgi:hypothetical protein
VTRSAAGDAASLTARTLMQMRHSCEGSFQCADTSQNVAGGGELGVRERRGHSEIKVMVEGNMPRRQARPGESAATR